MQLAFLVGVLSILAHACPTDSLFAAYDGEQPGASIAVIKDGTIVYEQAFGLANLEAQEKATPDTNYRLASVTKQFTAMAILLLEQRGKLKLDDKVTSYLPELSRIASKVTLRNLLTHTSGLPEYDRLLPDGSHDQVVDADVLAVVAKQTVPAVPGRYRYCNTGYALLAMVVERVSKQSFSEFLRDNIFKPAGMASTMVYDADKTIPHRAFGYDGNDERFWRKDQGRDTAVLGDGGIYSSTRDLAHWIDALDRSSLIDAKRLVEATSPLIRTTTPGISYGYGWRVGVERGEKLAWHTGTTTGFKNALLWVPSRKLGVVVLTNRRRGDPLMLATMMLEQFWDEPSPIRSVAPPIMPTITPWSIPILPLQATR